MFLCFRAKSCQRKLKKDFSDFELSRPTKMIEGSRQVENCLVILDGLLSRQLFHLLETILLHLDTISLMQVSLSLG